MAAIIIGPSLTVVVSSIALLLQALFLSHGGLTTLGGNIVSMGIIGAFSGWLAFQGARKVGIPIWWAAFMRGDLRLGHLCHDIVRIGKRPSRRRVLY